MDKNLLKKNFIWNIIGSGFTAFNSLFFMIIVTRINGINNAGIFTFAYATASFLNIIGTYSGRTYQINDDSDITDSDYFYSKIFTCFVMLIAGALFCLFRGYELSKTIVIIELIIYRGIDAFSEGFFAIIQEHNQLYKVGISLFLKAAIGLPCFLFIDLLTHSTILSILCIDITSLVIILFYDYRNVKLLNFNVEKLNIRNVVRTITLGFSAFAFCFLTQYVLNAPRYAIDSLLADKYQTIFGIIIMPATIVSLLLTFVLQPFVISLKNDLKEDKRKFLNLTLKLVLIIIILGVIVTIGVVLCGEFIFKLLYGINLKKYGVDLLLIMIGSVCYAITSILSTSLISMKSTFSQFMIYVIVSIFALSTSHFLVSNYSVLGACLNYFSSILLLLVLYICVFVFVYKKYSKRENLNINY